MVWKCNSRRIRSFWLLLKCLRQFGLSWYISKSLAISYFSLPNLAISCNIKLYQAGQSAEKGTVEKKYMRLWNIAVVPLKMNSITQLGLKDSKNIFGQACFYIISEFWSHLWLCHAATFCCFFGIAFGNTMKYCVFQS